MTRFLRDSTQTDAWTRSRAKDAHGAFSQNLTVDHAVVALQSIELLSKVEMRVYFRDSKILARIAGVPKSLIACTMTPTAGETQDAATGPGREL
jgi:hypothetical protein